jgi:hypothetical protein
VGLTSLVVLTVIVVLAIVTAAAYAIDRSVPEGVEDDAPAGDRDVPLAR